LKYLAERFPQPFLPERYQPHRPLKVGIAADLVTGCAELDRRRLGVALAVYARRVRRPSKPQAGQDDHSPKRKSSPRGGRRWFEYWALKSSAPRESEPVEKGSREILGVCAHARRLKQRPDIGATVTADRANEALFQVG
jgi:ProQ/FINO family